MEIDGLVTSGYGRGEKFLSQEFYSSKFIKKLNFKPYPGTLNIIVSEKFLNDIISIKKKTNNIIEGKDGFGSVKFIKAVLNNNINGAIVFPDKSTHEDNYLEFISKDKIREKLDLKDNDNVNLEIKDW